MKLGMKGETLQQKYKGFKEAARNLKPAKTES